MGSKIRKTGSGYRRLRRNRFIKEREHDTYKARGKPREPAMCSECSAVFHRGRWQWLPRPEGAHETLCPACQRQRDRYPGGYLTLGGDYQKQHRDEILRLVRNVEEREKQDHPLRRIMTIDSRDDDVQITTTTMGMARAIGDAVRHACKGELDYRYSDESNILHVAWRR